MAKKEVKNNGNGNNNMNKVGCCAGGPVFWGIFLLVIGIWVLAKDLGWIEWNVSIWAVALIFLGLWTLVKNKK